MAGGGQSDADAGRVLHLFAALGSQDEREIEDAYYMLKDFLSKPGNNKYIADSQVVPFLPVGIQHPNELIRSLTLEQLAVCIDALPTSISFLKANKLVPLAAKALGDEFSVAKRAESFFISLAKHKEGTELIFDAQVSAIMQELMGDEMHQLRVMDLFAEISQISEELFRHSQTQYLNPVVSAFHTTPDVLRKLNFVEIITKVSSTRWGLDYVQGSGVLESFYNILTEFIKLKRANDPSLSRSDSFLTNKIITFVGQVAKDSTGITFLAHLPFLDIIASHLEDFFNYSKHYFGENTEVSITAVGQIGQTKPGLEMLFAHSSVLRHYTAIMLTEDSDMLTCAFHSFANLFSTGLDTERMESIYKMLPSPFLPHVVKYTTKPFDELRYSAYHFMKGIAHHQWGVLILLQHAGYFEWLTNRDTEHTKPGKEWKFTIVQTLLTHKDLVESTLGAEKATEMQLYIKRGVFFTRPEVAVQVATQV